MNLELAIRLTEIILAFAFLQQSWEHVYAPANPRNLHLRKFYRLTQEQCLFIVRIILSILLLLGWQTKLVCLGLVFQGLWHLKYFQGPYNGGSDRMGLLILYCLSLTHFMPTLRWQEYIFGYLAMQLVLSYFISGWVKIVNPHWRSGSALQDVFTYSAYPASESLRNWAKWPRLLFLMSWAVMLFELLFPLFLLTKASMIIGLCIAASFHFSNACLFGLNRFFWTWLAAYPAIVWLQQRIFIG